MRTLDTRVGSAMASVTSCVGLLGFAGLVVLGCGSGSPPSPAFTPDSSPGDGEVASDGGDDTSSATETSTGSDASPDTGDDASSDAGPSGDAGAATFTQVYLQIINGMPDCNGCHVNPGAAAGLDLSSLTLAYTNLVGQPVTTYATCASQTDLLVDPGNASDSLMYLKVTTPPCGSQMPLGGPSLTTPQTELIQSWINAGALND